MALETQALISVLRKLPEVRLKLIEVAWQVVGEDGALDIDKLGSLSMDLKDAVREAHGYVDSTKVAICALKNIARS